MAVLDWVLFGGFLLIVVVQAWWFSRGKHTGEDYFLGGRRMHWLAVGISLFATIFSSLSFVGLPREGAYDDYHLYLAILFIPLVVAPIVGWLFIPVYHRLRLTSAYEYLGWRFSPRLRLFGSGLFCLYTLGWMGNMLFAGGLILLAALGWSNDYLPWLLVGMGVFTTVYTSVGGYKVVVWTDVVQAFLLAGAVLAVFLLALQRIDGGLATVGRLGLAHGKFDMFDFRFSLEDRANFYAACAYGMFVYMAANATGQAAVQRYVSMPSVSAARRSLVVNGALTAGVCLLFFLLGTTLFTFYHLNPAPEPNYRGFFPGGIKQDQITTHFVRTVLAYPGLLGLLLAGLFASVMSSMDSGINSLTAVVITDWLPLQKLGVMGSRLLGLLFGAMTIAIAIVLSLFEKNVFDIIITLAGAFFGPLLGVFVLGMLMPRANAGGAAIGLLAGGVSLIVVAMTPVSPWYYGAFTCIPTFVVGALASYLFRAPERERIRGLVWGGNRMNV